MAVSKTMTVFPIFTITFLVWKAAILFADFIGEDPAVKDLLDKAEKAAASNLPVLIIGETGTGKEIIAGAIHNGRNAQRPDRHTGSAYVTINCTAIPENLLESELFGHEKVLLPAPKKQNPANSNLRRRRYSAG